MIVKVQISISTSLSEHQGLVYNKDHTVWAIFSPIPLDVVMLMGGELKKFFHAELNGDGLLTLDAEADWQDW
jgi:hypothetical protein